jgi:hypothetical protein
VHRLELGVGVVQAPEGADANEYSGSASAEECHRRVDQAVYVESVDMADWSYFVRECQVPFQQGAHILGPGVVRCDHEV